MSNTKVVVFLILSLLADVHNALLCYLDKQITLHYIVFYIIFCLFSNNRSIYPIFKQKWSTPRVLTRFVE